MIYALKESPLVPILLEQDLTQKLSTIGEQEELEFLQRPRGIALDASTVGLLT